MLRILRTVRTLLSNVVYPHVFVRLDSLTAHGYCRQTFGNGVSISPGFAVACLPLLRIPADLFIALLGACVPLDFVARYLPPHFKSVPYMALWFVFALISHDSITAYYNAYIEFPNL